MDHREQHILQGLTADLLTEDVGDPPVEAFAPAAQRLPDYVEHAEGVPQSGALTAEVIVVEHESLVQKVQKAHDELAALESFCLGIVEQVKKSRTEIDELVTLIRGEASAAFIEVQKRSLMLDRLKRLCEGVTHEFQGT